MRLPFLFVCLFFTAECAVFSSDVVNQLSTRREKLAFYQKFHPVLKSLGRHRISPYIFDRSCLNVYRTNDYLFGECTLPPNCSEPSIVKLDKTFYGQETVVCHSSSRKDKSSEFEFFNISFTPRPVALREPITLYGKVFTQLKNMKPVSFFEWYYIVKSDDNRFGIVPRICDELFHHSSRLPKTVRIEHRGDDVCFVELAHDSLQCDPILFPSLPVLFTVHDFPIEFDGVPFSQGSFASTNNKVMGADAYSTNNLTRTPRVIDKVGGSYMVTYDALDYSGPLFIVRSHGYLPTDKPYCFHLAAHYTSPLSNILSNVSKFFRNELGYLLEFLKEIAADLAFILFKIISEIFDIIMSFVPYNSHFYSALFVCSFTYLMLRDLVISLAVLVAVYCVKIYSDSSI